MLYVYYLTYVRHTTTRGSDARFVDQTNSEELYGELFIKNSEGQLIITPSLDVYLYLNHANSLTCIITLKCISECFVDIFNDYLNLMT